MPPSKSKKRLAAMRFLDLEASEDEDDEEVIEQREADESEGEGEYLADVFPEERPLFQPNRRSDEEFGALVESFLPDPTRTHARRPDENYNLPGIFERISLDEDYPLWRIKCRKHTEEMALYSLLNTAKPYHEIRSVFSKDAEYLYLECTMNEKLITLLKKTPGLILSTRESIPQQDYRETLRISRTTDVSNGSWVEITKGMYKGDVGLVVEKRIGGAEVILIPRLPPPSQFIRPCKRKSDTIAFPPVLFDPQIFKAEFPKEVSCRSEGVYTFRKQTFENGLERRLFKRNFLNADPNDMPYDSFKIFINTGHPNVKMSYIPRPREWLFEEREEVEVVSKGTRGTLTKINPYHAIVETSQSTFDNVSESYVPWLDIRKHISVGDYVKVRTGSESGFMGWVTEIVDEKVTIINVEANRADVEETPSHTATKKSVVHINTLQKFEVPYYYASTNDENSPRLDISSYVVAIGGQYVTRTGWIVEISGEDAVVVENIPEGGIYNVPKSEFIKIPLRYLVRTQHSQVQGELVPLQSRPSQKLHPWIGLDVVVFKKHHQSKGFCGKVVGVTPGQGGLPQTKLDVRSINYDPSMPFSTFRFNYDEIVEISSYKKLNDFLAVSQPRLLTQTTTDKAPTSALSESLSTPSACYSNSALKDLSPAWDPASTITPDYLRLPSDYLRLPSFSPMPSPMTPVFTPDPSLWSPSKRLSRSPMTPVYTPDPSLWSPSKRLSRSPMTPVYTPDPFPASSSSSPLCNFSGRTPSWDGPSSSCQLVANSVSSAASSHPFLNVLLHGVSLKAEMGGKDVVVAVDAADGCCSIRKKEYHSSVLVPPEQVTPKHPNPARDNGLLVVIKGDHAMKFVRRIHHCSTVEAKPMLLAVVTRSENSIDKLTGEEFELTSDHLCCVVESSESKELNKNLMDALRKQYKGKNI